MAQLMSEQILIASVTTGKIVVDAITKEIFHDFKQNEICILQIPSIALKLVFLKAVMFFNIERQTMTCLL